MGKSKQLLLEEVIVRGVFGSELKMGIVLNMLLTALILPGLIISLLPEAMTE